MTSVWIGDFVDYFLFMVSKEKKIIKGL